ncbi:MAG: HAMP domain-containing protein [Anaerolineales bacterium]|nr:MAG: HAMP domain-containing protein [Anaerolineales bacterium]
MPIWKRAYSQSITSQFRLAFVVVIIATTIAAGIPAYLIIRSELQQQAWSRLADGSQITRTLLGNEQDRLVDLGNLTSQRPTLRKYMIKGSTERLREYLRVYQSSVDLDILFAYDADCHPLTLDSSPNLCMDLLVSSQRSSLEVLDTEPRLVSVVHQQVFDDINNQLLGYVTLGVYLDDEFVSQLASASGFIQSVMLDGRRVASSMPSLPETVQFEGHGGAEDANIPLQTGFTLAGIHYQGALSHLDSRDDGITAYIETALSVESMVSAESRGLLIMLISTFVVIVVSSLLAGEYARKLTAPLLLLTSAATNISEGNLSTPVPCPEQPSEIATLAQAFEESRNNLGTMLEDLTQEKAWSEALIHSIVEGIVTMDSHGQITSFSQGAERITGCSQEDALNEPLDVIFVVPEGAPKFSDQLPHPGGMQQIEIVTHDGHQKTLSVTNAELVQKDHDASESALVLRDITEKGAVRNFRSYFLANISHEFLTPLSAISAPVELLLDELDDLSKDDISKLLNSIHMSVTGLQALIDNLLESMSIEAGRFKIRRRHTDLNDIITDAVHMMQPLLDRRKQELHLNIKGQIPEVRVDPTRLTQVLVNLLSNASKYSPLSAPVHLTLEHGLDDVLRVSVSDRGPGIPPKDREDVFRRFVRLEAHDEAHYGVGLGLSVVKAIIEEHGGEVGVEGRPDGGSIFWFELPCGGGPG